MTTYASPDAALAALLAAGWVQKPYTGTVSVQPLSGNQAVKIQLSNPIAGSTLQPAVNVYGPNPTTGQEELQSANYYPNIMGDWLDGTAGTIVMPLQPYWTADPSPTKWCEYTYQGSVLHSSNYFAMPAHWDMTVTIIDTNAKIWYLIPYFGVNVASPAPITYVPGGTTTPAPTTPAKGNSKKK